MKKVIVITGSKGSGKSTAAADYIPPVQELMSGVCVVDTEDSMNDIVEGNKALGLEWGEYIRAYERLGLDESSLSLIAQGRLPWVTETDRKPFVAYYEWLVDKLNKVLLRRTFHTLVLDTVEPIEASMTAWVEDNKGPKGASGWGGSWAYGRRETEGVRPLYEGILEACNKLGVQNFILTSHVKQASEGEGERWHKIPNKVEPGGRMALLTRISSMMFWLVPEYNNSDGAPAALVLKARLQRREAVDGKWVRHAILPRRIPHFTWDDVERYKDNPPDLANPKPGEKPSQKEIEMMSEFFTDEQMRLMVLGAEQELARTRAETSETRVITFAQPEPEEKRNAPDNILAVKMALSSGKGAAEVAAEYDMPLPEVLRIARG